MVKEGPVAQPVSQHPILAVSHQLLSKKGGQHQACQLGAEQF